MKKSELPEELGVLLSLPVVCGHSDRDRLRAPGNPQCRQDAYAERNPAQGIFAKK
jgi:hypothetical protein